MTWSLDARIPLLVVSDRTALAAALRDGTPAAVLAEAELPKLAEAEQPKLPPGAVGQARFAATGPHAGGCGCCGGRSPAALALDRLFQARVKGETGWFQRVVALAPGEAARGAILAALREDAVTRARFRVG